MWKRYWDFYVGGEQLRRNASLYLVRRQKEPNDVYAERLSRVFYENYLGSCVDWYASTLFRSRPVTTFRSSSARIEEFYARFLEDGDRRGKSVLEIARKVFIETLAYRESYVLIDFPRVSGQISIRRRKTRLGSHGPIWSLTLRGS